MAVECLEEVCHLEVVFHQEEVSHMVEVVHQEEVSHMVEEAHQEEAHQEEDHQEGHPVVEELPHLEMDGIQKDLSV